MTELEKILMGKGRLDSLKHVECKNPWRGAQVPSNPVFDAAQAAENKRLYPHLFRDDRR